MTAPLFIMQKPLMLVGALVSISLFKTYAMPLDDAALQCALTIESQQQNAVFVRLSLTNTTDQTFYLDKSATPFEGWKARFVSLSRDDIPLEYQGRMVKRGASTFPQDYIRFTAHESVSQVFALHEGFNLQSKGNYQLEYTGIFQVREEANSQSTLIFPRCNELHFKS